MRLNREFQTIPSPKKIVISFLPPKTKHHLALKMNWPKRDTKTPSVVSYILTPITFCVAIAVAVVTTPFVQFYYYIGSFPTTDQSKEIFDNLGSDIWGVILSSVSGLVLLIITMALFRFGKFLSVLITMLEFYALYISATLFASWLTWKYNTTLDSTLVVMLPFLILQLSVFLVLEIGAILGQGGRVAYGFVALSASLGAFAGALRSVDQDYFYYNSTGNPFANDTNLGVAFGNSVIDTVFLVGSCAMCGVCIARSKCGGSTFWHIVALILPTGLACAFSMYVELSGYVPKIESDVARYICGSVIAVVALLLAVGLFAPIRKLQQSQPERGSRNTYAQGVGPVAANAVVLV